MAIDPDAHEIFVISAGSAVVTVVDSTTNTVKATINLPEASTGSITLGNGTVYIPINVPANPYIYTINETTDAGGQLIPANVGDIVYDTANGMIYGQHGNFTVGISARSALLIWNTSIGYAASGLAVGDSSGVVYALGCSAFGLVCGSEITFLDANNGEIIAQNQPGSAYYATMTVNEESGLVYVSGGEELVSYGPYGNQIYKTNPLTCGPFIGMANNPQSDQVIMIPQDYNYLLVYDGWSLALVNMYALPAAPSMASQVVAYNPGNRMIYVLLPGELVSLNGSEPLGHVNSTLIAPSQNCLPV